MYWFIVKIVLQKVEKTQFEKNKYLKGAITLKPPVIFHINQV